jgi:hypothetical protein
VGLDVYVGPLTRYHLGDWLTIVQQMGRRNGMTVRIMRDGPDVAAEPGEVTAAVGAWRTGLADGLNSALDWPEGPDLPYWTDKPDWDGFGAIVLAAAYEVEPDLRPWTSEELGWSQQQPDDPRRYSTAPAVLAAAQHPEPFITLLSGVEWWLPLPGGWVIEAPRPLGSPVRMAAVEQLVDELELLAGRLGLSDESRWQQTVQTGPPASGAPVEDVARFGLSVLLPLAYRAHEQRQPLLLDY